MRGAFLCRPKKNLNQMIKVMKQKDAPIWRVLSCSVCVQTDYTLRTLPDDDEKEEIKIAFTDHVGETYTPTIKI